MRALPAMVVAICAAAAGGCKWAAEGALFSEARAAPVEGKAVVYVYRKDAVPHAFGATLCIDDREVVTLKQGGFTWAYLSPGTHLVEVRWPAMSGAPDPSTKLAAAAGATYHFEVTGLGPTIGYAPPPLVGLLMLFSRSTFQESELRETKAEDAEATMSQFCRFQAPRAPEY